MRADNITAINYQITIEFERFKSVCHLTMYAVRAIEKKDSIATFYEKDPTEVYFHAFLPREIRLFFVRLNRGEYHDKICKDG